MPVVGCRVGVGQSNRPDLRSDRTRDKTRQRLGLEERSASNQSPAKRLWTLGGPQTTRVGAQSNSVEQEPAQGLGLRDQVDSSGKIEIRIDLQS